MAPPKRRKKHLTDEQTASLLAAHQAGTGVTELARQFGIHRRTVSDILRRRGAHRSPGLRPDDIPEVVRLYEAGWTLARLGEQFNAAPSTIGRTFRAEGVTIRPRGGRRPNAGLSRARRTLLAARHCVVGLLQACSNPADLVERLRRLLDLPRRAPSPPPTAPPKRRKKHLTDEQTASFLAAHQAGTGVTELARQFGIHRRTVSDILRREGAHRTPGLHPDHIPEAVRLYEAGWTLTQLGERFNAAPSTISRTLRTQGVTIRPRGGLTWVSG